MKGFCGFTLLEIMITVAIVGVVTAIAVPSAGVYVKNSRLTSQINALVSDLHLARSEAVGNSQQMVLCPSANATSCSGSDWAKGWIMFSDLDANGQVDSIDTILRVQQALTSSNTLTSTGIGTRVIYDNRGFTSSTSGTFSLCDDRGTANIKTIAISKTGHIRKVKPSESSSC